MNESDRKHIQESFESKQLRFQKTPFLSYKERVSSLKKLKKVIQNKENEILEALKSDFNKPILESYVTEISLVIQEINHTLDNLKDWMRIKKVHSPMYLFPSRSRMQYVPKGVVLILGPWNYPFLLIMDPLINAISAGNNVIAKLPNQTPKTSDVMASIISEVFEKDHVSTLVMEDLDVIPELIHPNKFAHIFFTGSERVGKLIYASAAENLIPVTLELGGKSPCIVDETANLKLAAKKIIWGKMINAGQTCVAPDYILVDQRVKETLVQELTKNIELFHAKKEESDYAHLIHEAHFENMSELKSHATVIYGGTTNSKSRYFQPTLVEIESLENPVMQKEIFGPILPIIAFKDFSEVKDVVNQNSHPLAFYIFSKNKKRIKRALHEIPFGGACVNDVLLHLGVPDLPFGGIGSSGMGSYHGFKGFETFSHTKSIVRSSSWFDMPMKYPPYTEKQRGLLKTFLKLK